MSVIDEIIKIKDNCLCFGNYLVSEKQKIDNFEFNGDKYRVRTHKTVTRFEKNDKMVLETVPGATIHKFKADDDKISFEAEGFDSTQITLELEPNQNYKLEVDNILLTTSKTNAFGKFSFSLNLDSVPKSVLIEKV